MPEEHKETIPLTDPVVEDISKQTPPSPPPPPAEPQAQTPVPATPPKSNRSPVVIPLVVITLLAVSAASLFYNQNRQLKNQVQDLINTIETQETIPVSEITPQPTTEISQQPTPVATATAAPDQAKTEAQQALALAQEKYPQAQLILITIDNPHLQDQSMAKYWFRQSPNTKKYLYVSYYLGKVNLIDQQVYVSPDNDIPSLNQRLTEGQLGLTIDQVLSLAASLCPEPEACQKAQAIKLQFLDTGASLLWQATYQIQDQPQPFVFQIDSLTKKVVYQSENTINK